MSARPKVHSISIGAVLLLGALATSPSAHGDASVFFAQQSSIHRAQGNSGLIQTSNPPLVPDLVLYENLMDYVGAENDRIQREIDGEAARIENRTDYCAVIGISKDDEQTLLSILINAFHRREEIQKQKNKAAHDGAVAAARDDEPAALAAQTREAQFIRAQGRVDIDLWTTLKDQLSDASLRKIDAYVNREFTDDLYSAKTLVFTRSQNTF